MGLKSPPKMPATALPAQAVINREPGRGRQPFCTTPQGAGLATAGGSGRSLCTWCLSDFSVSSKTRGSETRLAGLKSGF